MLILARKVGETILIGNGIEVTLVAVRGNRVMLGIVAPPDVRLRNCSPPGNVAGSHLPVRGS